MEIRHATDADLDAIRSIYNHEVQNSTATLDTVSLTEEQQRTAFEKHQASTRYPLIVAVQDKQVVGWAALKAWSDRLGYQRAAEVSVYVHQDHRCQGVGRRLLEELITAAKRVGLCVLLARITNASEHSLSLHQRLGFTSIGVMRGIGEKFGNVLDVTLMDLHLDD